MHPLHRKEDLVVQEVDDETLVYDLKTHKAKCLNPTSSKVWKLCDGNHTPQEIAELLSTDSPAVPVEVVNLALDQLQNEDLLAETKGSGFQDGVSRRDVIKKAALTSAVALPVISVLIAPIPAQAQSGAQACVPVGGGCTCAQINSGRKGLECTPSIPCQTNCRCVHANNGNNHTGDCVV